MGKFKLLTVYQWSWKIPSYLTIISQRPRRTGSRIAGIRSSQIKMDLPVLDFIPKALKGIDSIWKWHNQTFPVGRLCHPLCLGRGKDKAGGSLLLAFWSLNLNSAPSVSVNLNKSFCGLLCLFIKKVLVILHRLHCCCLEQKEILWKHFLNVKLLIHPSLTFLVPSLSLALSTCYPHNLLCHWVVQTESIKLKASNKFVLP